MLVGYGRVGGLIGAKLIERGVPLLVIEENEEKVAALKAQGVEAIADNAVTACVTHACMRPRPSSSPCRLLRSGPDRRAGPCRQCRTTRDRHVLSDEEEAYLKGYGASDVVQGSREIADSVLSYLQKP